MSYAAQIFLSHSSADRALTEALAALFRTSGFDSLFIDFDPMGGVAPGRNWETELYTALRRCDAVVGVDSPEWRNSQWCFAEIALARSLGKTVIVVQVGEQRPESGDSGTAGLTADLQRIVLPAVTESYAEPLFRELVAMGMGRLRSLRLVTGRPPYAGLLPLQEEDAGVFFGRQEETRTLVDLIEKLTKYREKRMVLLIGPSGSGKSSLLRAGIIPQFRQRPGWKVVAPDPLNYETAMREMDAVPGDAMVLMGLDQIDEALTESDGAIFVLLRYAVERRQKRCLVIGTLRSESLATFNERLGGIAEFIERFVVGPLTRSNYREIIELPAQAAGGSVDPNLVDALLADIASSRDYSQEESRSGSISSDALPLLAVTLRQLWDFRTPASELTLTSYERIGRLDGAIARTAETVMAASRLDADDLAQLRRAFLGMVRIDREGHFSRRPLRLNDLQGRQREVLLRFVNEGLLVIGSTPGAIDLAHEALIRTWPLLASWVEGAREDLLRLERFETAVEQWRQNRKAVLQGIGLAEAEELALKGYDALNSQDATQLLDLSRKERNQALAREQERLQSLRVSESLRLASEAREASVQEPETAFLVAWEAVLWDRNEVSEAVFRETLNRLPASVMILRPGSGNLYISAGFAGNGMTLFAADTRNGAVSVWELDGRPLSRFVVSGDGTMAIAALPGRSELITCRGQIARLHSVDGRILHELPLDPSPPKASDGLAISVAADCTCLIHAHGKGWLIHVGEGRDRLLRLMRSLDFVWLPSRTGEMPTEQDWDGPFHQPFSRILDATIKQDGQMLLTQGSDSVRVWNTDGTLRAALSVDGVSSAKFLAQDRIVTGTMGGAGELWNSTGASLAVLKTGGGGLDLFIKAVDPSAERFAATVNRSGLIEIWSATGELQSTLRAHQGHAWSAAFSPNSQHLASGGEDRVIRVWDWAKERCLFELYGHKSKVNAVEFHPTKPSLLVSSDLNGEVRLWGLDSPVRARHRGHNQAVRAMVLAPTGVLSSAADTMLWRFPEGNSYPLGGKLIGWNSSSRGGAAATADSSGVVRLWTWEPTTEPICHCEFRPHNDSPIRDATSSADWSKLVVVSENGVELWSDGGEHVCDLIGTNLPRTDQQRNAARWSGFRRDGAAIMTAAINGAVWLWGADGSPEGNFLADNASPDRIFDVDLDPQDEYILVGIRNEAGLWTWQGDLALELPSSGYKVLTVRFMPDGFRIVTIADNPSGGPSALVDLWNRDGEKLASPSAPNANEIIFDPESRYFCLQSSTDARIFDRDGALLGTLAAAAGTYIRSLAISATGTRVGALFSDGKVRLWDFTRRRRVGVLEVGEANCISFTPDSRSLLAASPEGLIEQYTLDIAELFPIAARHLNRAFTAEEIERFAIQRPVRLNLAEFG